MVMGGLKVEILAEKEIVFDAVTPFPMTKQSL
jgi:hypothetical protein